MENMGLNKKALFKFLCSVVLLGLNGIMASHIALTSYEIVFLRNLIGLVLLAAVFFAGKGRIHIKEYRREVIFVGLSGMAMGLNWMFLFEAYKHIGVSLSSLLVYCAPVTVAMLSPILFKEKLTLFKIAGFVIVFSGVVMVNGEIAASDGSIWGMFCGIMSAVAYFCIIVFNKQAKNIRGMENAVVQLIGCFIVIAAFLGARQLFVIHIPPEAWPWILELGVVNTGVACYLYFSSLPELPVQTISAFSYVEPLSAVFFAALLLGEKMTVIQIIGAVCIIGGAMIAQRT